MLELNMLGLYLRIARTARAVFGARSRSPRGTRTAVKSLHRVGGSGRGAFEDRCTHASANRRRSAVTDDEAVALARRASGVSIRQANRRSALGRRRAAEATRVRDRAWRVAEARASAYVRRLVSDGFD